MRLKIAVPMMLLLLLCACKAAEESAQTAVSLRTGLVSSGECSFFRGPEGGLWDPCAGVQLGLPQRHFRGYPADGAWGLRRLRA